MLLGELSVVEIIQGARAAEITDMCDRQTTYMKLPIVYQDKFPIQFNADGIKYPSL